MALDFGPRRADRAHVLETRCRITVGFRLDKVQWADQEPPFELQIILDGLPMRVPVSLYPGGELRLRLHYAPKDGGTSTGTVKLIRPGAEGPGVAVAIKVSGQSLTETQCLMRAEQDPDCDGVDSALDCDPHAPDLGAVLYDADCDGVLVYDDCDDTDAGLRGRTGSGDCTQNRIQHLVRAGRGMGGVLAPTEQRIAHGETASVSIQPDEGYEVDSAVGCGGALAGLVYTTALVSDACEVEVTFRKKRYTVNVNASEGGTIGRESGTVEHGDVIAFALTPDRGYAVEQAMGCDGAITDAFFLAGPITRNCEIEVVFARKRYAVDIALGAGGQAEPPDASVWAGATEDFVFVPEAGFAVDEVMGCGGTLNGTRYSTGEIFQACTIMATFKRRQYEVRAEAIGGMLMPAFQQVAHGERATFAAHPEGEKKLLSIEGCGGRLDGPNYVTAPVQERCTITARFVSVVSDLSVSVAAPKRLRFTWTDVGFATGYHLDEDPDGVSGYSQVARIDAAVQGYEHIVPVHLRGHARYRIRACDAEDRCVASGSLPVAGSLREAIGYLKAVDAGPRFFGGAIAHSADGGTLAVGAPGADGGAGAVYVLVRDGTAWTHQATVGALTADALDLFGASVALSADGKTLAVGAPGEASAAEGINGDQTDNSAIGSGAVYVFERSEHAWSQRAYLKTDGGSDLQFGASVSLSAAGDLLAAGAPGGFLHGGSDFLFERERGSWSQVLRGTAPDSFPGDRFAASTSLSADGETYAIGSPGSQTAYLRMRVNGGWVDASVRVSGVAGIGNRVALSADGMTLVVGAMRDRSSTSGIDSLPDDVLEDAGAVYVFARVGNSWVRQAYIKASNTGFNNQFGASVAISADGNLIAVGAPHESSASSGIDGDQSQEISSPTIGGTGAVYVFERASGVWSQRSYVKASNPGPSDLFGYSVALNPTGTSLFVGAVDEESSAIGVGGDQDNNATAGAGAVYVY